MVQSSDWHSRSSYYFFYDDVVFGFFQDMSNAVCGAGAHGPVDCTRDVCYYPCIYMCISSDSNIQR